MSAPVSWSRIGLLSLGAAGLFGAYSLLPAGSRLDHMDFLADKASVLQFCDPQNVRPLPTQAGRPAVAMTVQRVPGAPAGKAVMTLTTISGKPVGPADLLPVGGRKISLEITDAAGGAVHPGSVVPASKAGEWTFQADLAGKGPWRAVATFTPAATGKTLTAEARW